MKGVPDKETLKAFEQQSRYHLAPWLQQINENLFCFRWWFYLVCQHYEIATAMELGVNLARTTCILAAAVTDLAIGVEIAPDWGWINKTIGTMPEEHRGKLHIVIGDSIAPQTVADVEKILNGRPLELMFIDGKHTAEHVTAELAAYMPMLAPNALVVMDDLINHPPLQEVFYSIPGVHVELNHLHALGGLGWASSPPAQSAGFGAVIVNQEGGG